MLPLPVSYRSGSDCVAELVVVCCTGCLEFQAAEHLLAPLVTCCKEFGGHKPNRAVMLCEGALLDCMHIICTF